MRGRDEPLSTEGWVERRASVERGLCWKENLANWDSAQRNRQTSFDSDRTRLRARDDVSLIVDSVKTKLSVLELRKCRRRYLLGPG